MASLTLTTQEVVIEAKAPLVRTDLTSSHTTIESCADSKTASGKRNPAFNITSRALFRTPTAESTLEAAGQMK